MWRSFTAVRWSSHRPRSPRRASSRAPRAASRLGVSPYTVKEHLDRACEKIGTRGRKALVARLFVDAYLPTLRAPKARLGA
jgi:hypothetical protein